MVFKSAKRTDVLSLYDGGFVMLYDRVPNLTIPTLTQTNGFWRSAKRTGVLSLYGGGFAMLYGRMPNLIIPTLSQGRWFLRYLSRTSTWPKVNAV